MDLTVDMAFCAPAPDKVTITIVRGDDRPADLHAQAVAIVDILAKYLPADTWDEVYAEMDERQEMYSAL